MPTPLRRLIASSSAKASSSSGRGPGFRRRHGTKRSDAARRSFAARSRSSPKPSASCARAGLSEEEIRRLFEAELTGFGKAGGQSG